KDQDLTKHEIRVHIQDILQKDSAFQKLSVEDPSYNSLVDEILEAARRVFLWVHWVLQLLLDGVTNQDRICDLQVGLHRLPRGLKHLYRHKTSTIPSQYWRQAAQSLLIASTPCLESLGSKILSHLFTDDVEYLESTDPDSMLPPKLIDKIIPLKHRIAVFTKGLLEVHDLGNRAQGAGFYSLACSELPTGHRRFVVAHRTVRDFLRTKGVNNRLLKEAQFSSIIEHFVLRSLVAALQSVCSL
ncbi:hypothetical protein EJ02DRAFT_360447, partial [Clathrospora elynae]